MNLHRINSFTDNFLMFVLTEWDRLYLSYVDI